MGEEPQLPPIPAIGDVLDRKKSLIEKKYTVIKCDNCQNTFTRDFKPGDFVFKEIRDEECERCQRRRALTIIEIYSEWINPKKSKK
jgi:Zn finger protein HypA/HybF involved in hydrogenase expression